MLFRLWKLVDLNICFIEVCYLGYGYWEVSIGFENGLALNRGQAIIKIIVDLDQLEHLCSEKPPTAPWLPILVAHIRSLVKKGQSQSYKFKKIAKNCNFELLQETLYATHILKLLDKMYKYEMDPTRTVGATERTREAGRTDGRSETNIPPNNFVVCGV